VRHQLRDILLLVVPHFSLTGRIGSRTSQPAASNCGGVSHAGRMTSEPFDAVSERTARGGQENPFYDGCSRRPLMSLLPGRSRVMRRRGTGPRTCPTCPSHIQNEGLACEVSAVGMASSDKK